MDMWPFLQKKKKKKETKKKKKGIMEIVFLHPLKKDNFLPYYLLFENICQLYHHTPLYFGHVIC